MTRKQAQAKAEQLSAQTGIQYGVKWDAAGNAWTVVLAWMLSYGGY